MIKTIKHIISLFAITSVLALSFMGCEQPTTPEVKDTVAPAEVSDLKAVTEDKKVILSWTNPTDEDFYNVIITYDGKTRQTETGEARSIEITELENGKVYTFKVQTVDKKQNKSIGKTIEHIYNPYNLTIIPKKVKTKDITVNDKVKTYDIVEFGDWPQTKLTDENIITNKDSTVLINGWECYYGSDGAYYVEVIAAPDSSCSDKFTTGSKYYFKLEPIQWRVLTDKYNTDKKLLFAEKALANCVYFPYEQEKATRTIKGESNDIENNNYKYSEVRAFLNGYNYVKPDNSENTVHNGKGFLQKAFTKAAIEKIVLTDVDNSNASTIDTGNNLPGASDFACANTTDKIFLLSEKEITTAEYGFDAYDKYVGSSNGITTSTRIKNATDYARATGAYADPRVYSWLRSPTSYSQYARFVNRDGAANCTRLLNSKDMVVVPALTISSYEK